MKGIIKRLLNYITLEDEAELLSRYKTEVVDCHPFDTPVPISFEEFKALQES